jgi:hypothetical protein
MPRGERLMQRFRGAYVALFVFGLLLASVRLAAGAGEQVRAELNNWGAVPWSMTTSLGNTFVFLTGQVNDPSDASSEFKFFSGADAWFGNGAFVNIGQIFGGLNQAGGNSSFNHVQGAHYAFKWNGNDRGVIFQFFGPAASVSSVSVPPNPVIAANPVNITAQTNIAPPPGQGVWLRYSIDNFVNSTVVRMTGGGNVYSASIPGFAAGVIVRYYVFTSGDVFTIAPADADLMTINANTNGGANFSYTVVNPGVTPTNTPPSPTPTDTPIPPTPIAGCIDNVIVNGSFEQNDFWVFGETPVRPGFVSSPVQQGLRAVRLGPEPPAPDRHSFSSIRQPIFIPNNAIIAQLRWWAFSRTEEAPLGVVNDFVDRQEVILLNPDLSTYAVLRRTRQNTNAYVEQFIDFTPYIGKNLLLYFNVWNDGNGLRTWEFVDNVIMRVCYPEVVPTPTGPPTATPTPSPTATVTPTPTATASPTATPTELAMSDAARSGVAAPITITPLANGEPVVLTTAPRIGGGLNPDVANILIWLGVMLGAIAVIALIVVIINQHGQGNPPPPP